MEGKELDNFFETVGIQEDPALLITDKVTPEISNAAKKFGYMICTAIDKARENLILGNKILYQPEEQHTETITFISQMGRWSGSLQWFDEAERRFIIKNCDRTQAKLIVVAGEDSSEYLRRIVDEATMIHRVI